VLLLLDNFEHVLASAAQLAELLAATPTVKLLVTSREPLRLRWERILALEPLDVPDPAHLPSLPAQTEVPAVALFVDRARAVRADFALTDQNRRAVAELCLRLGGLPLAINLAAARTTVLTPGAMLTRMEQRLPLLRWAAADVPSRHQTMRAAIDWSYSLLTPTE
jgi:predicted ATPase